jgi:hypothetical protein
MHSSDATTHRNVDSSDGPDAGGPTSAGRFISIPFVADCNFADSPLVPAIFDSNLAPKVSPSSETPIDDKRRTAEMFAGEHFDRSKNNIGLQKIGVR